jgi:SPP1 family predicted phage head-tail adaptor
MSVVSSSLRERIRIEKPIATDDGYGGQTRSWQEVATVFAQVLPMYLNQGEHEVASQRNARAGYRINIRMRGDLDASMRIIWKTHMLNIHSLHEQGDVLGMLTYEEQL